MSIQRTAREHWHATATDLARLDCSLLNLRPDDDRELAKLPGDLYAQVLKKLDELAGEACRDEGNGISRQDIHREMAKAIWNFLKPWKRNELLPATISEQTQHVRP